MRTLQLSIILCLAVSFAVAAPNPPEKSKLFERRVDPESGVVSFILKPKIHAFNQQSIYFTCKSMSDDGRFLLFHSSPGETGGPKVLSLVDLEKDEISDIIPTGGLPSFDVKANVLYYVDSKNMRICRRDLMVDPMKDVVLCDVPAELRPEGGDTRYLVSHLTLSRNHDKAFFDSCVRGRFIHGIVDLATGKYEKWGETPFLANHGQINPVNDRQAMVAWEICWTGEVGARYKKFGSVYPRMWVVEPGNRFRHIATVRNYATHEKWSEDGKGIYFCSKGGVWFHEIDTDRQYCVSPIHAVHATMTADNRYVTFDSELEPNYRGCSWRVGFTNRNTGRSVWIHSRRPPLNPRERPSTRHPDPHPTFVSQDRYIVCTINNADGHMDLSLTPVAQLLEMTAEYKR